MGAATASVVIPALGRQAVLSKVLRAFGQQTTTTPFEVIVVDDGSPEPINLDDHDAEGCRLVRHEHTLGRASAINTGFEHAAGSILIICDSDVLPDPHFVAAHLAFHRRSAPHATCLGALRNLSSASLWARLVGARSNPYAPVKGEIAWYQWYTDNWSVRISGELPTIFFDPRFQGWGWEDFDLGYRLSRLGFTSHFNEEASATHLSIRQPAELRRSLEASRGNLEILCATAAAEPAAQFWASTSATGTDRALCSDVLDGLLTRVQSTLERCPHGKVAEHFAASLFNLMFLPSIARLVDKKLGDGIDATALAAHAVRELLMLQRSLGDTSGLDDTIHYWRQVQSDAN